MVAEKNISRRRACRWRSRVRIGMSRNALQEPAVVEDKDIVLKAEIESLAHRHKQWGGERYISVLANRVGQLITGESGGYVDC